MFEKPIQPNQVESSPEQKEAEDANQYFELLLFRLAELKGKERNSLTPEEEEELAYLEEQAEAFNDGLGGEIVEISED